MQENRKWRFFWKHRTNAFVARKKLSDWYANADSATWWLTYIIFYYYIMSYQRSEFIIRTEIYVPVYRAGRHNWATGQWRRRRWKWSRRRRCTTASRLSTADETASSWGTDETRPTLSLLCRRPSSANRLASPTPVRQGAKSSNQTARLCPRRAVGVPSSRRSPGNR